MIANDKTFVAVQGIQNFVALFVVTTNEYISKMVNVISRSNDRIPVLNQTLIHDFRISERSSTEVNDILMKEVRI